MYKCADCGRVFEEDDLYRWEERHGLDSPPYEQWAGCPSCHSTSYEEAHLCNGCGEYFAEGDDYGGGWCHECARASYNDKLGLKYVRSSENTSLDFIEYRYGVELSGSGNKQYLANLILRDFEKLVEMDCELNRMSIERKNLKAYCLDTDIDYWIAFINRKDDNDE